MSTWELNTLATSSSGIVTETLEHDERKAMINVTETEPGEHIVTLSLVIRGIDPKWYAEQLLRDLADRAVPK